VERLVFKPFVFLCLKLARKKSCCFASWEHIKYVDDAKVIAFVWNILEDDVEEYKKWQIRNGKRVI